MAKNPNFEDVLDREVDSIEKPPVKPVGTFLCRVVGFPTEKTITAQGEERQLLTFTYKAISPMPDVSQDALANPLLGDISTWPSRTRDIWDYKSPEGLNTLKILLKDVFCIDTQGKKIKEALAEVPGRQVYCHFQHRPYVDKNTGQPEISWDIDSVAKV